MGERCNRTAEASGSIPLSSTNVRVQFLTLSFFRRKLPSPAIERDKRIVSRIDAVVP